MKYRLKIVMILMLSSAFCSCQRELVDYRSKYTGNWIFNVEIKEVNTDSIGAFVFDTIRFRGIIGYGEESDEISIQYTEDNEVRLRVNEAGVLSCFPSQYSNGEFENDTKVHLYLRWGGLGGGVTHVVNGEKTE